MASKSKIESFDFEPGKRLLGRYVVEGKLGGGYEGEVYKVEEILTKKKRAIKLYYPHRNIKFKVSTRYAQKLDKLNSSHIVMNYHSHEMMSYRGEKIACIVSEFIQGEMLGSLVNRQRGKKLGVFPALHLLYSLVKGLEVIHLSREYHGDLHTDNIMVQKLGLEFEIKILDFHHWGDSVKDNRDEDIIKTIRIFYDILGGAKQYPKLPDSIKNIICGLKRNLILKKFKNIAQLRIHLETMEWTDAI